MKIKTLAYYIITFLFALHLVSCESNKKPQTPSIWENTTWETLEGERIRFRKPHKLMRSSRYRIERDSPTIASDTSMLRVLQNTLENLEFEDSQIDVFIDTTTYFHVLIICNVPPIHFGTRDVAIIKKQLTDQNRATEKFNPNLKYEEVNAKVKQTKKIKVAKFESNMIDLTQNGKLYQSTYYLTTSSYSLVVYEFSDYNKGIEDYLWSVKQI